METNIGIPGDGISELPSPHGLGTDLNGYLYIGETGGGGSEIRKFTCDGEILDESEFAITTSETKQNFFSIENTLYINSNGGPTAFDLCTGDVLGQVCLNQSGNTNLWGLHYNPVTEMFYATSRGDGNEVWQWNAAENEQALAGNLCIDPLTTIPGNGFPLFGIVSDNAGIIYVVESDLGNGVYIHKLDALGNEIDVVGPSNNSLPWGSFIGIVYSEDQERLYTSNYSGSVDRDCISMFDTNLDYIGTGLANPPGGGSNSKAIAIIKECCPTQDLNFTETVCSSGNGELVYLQDVFGCGEGIICEGNWSVSSPNVNQDFDECNLAIEINGSGCATYVLEKNTGATGSQQCGVFTVTLEVCTEVPTATFVSEEGTCDGINPNDDATIDISGVMNADQANYSLGVSYSGPAYNAQGFIDLSNGIGQITGLMHDAQYTIRVFNGSDDCYSDYTLTTEAIECFVFDLALSKILDSATTPGPFYPGDNVAFDITVYNQGNIEALDVEVTDYIPAGFIFNQFDNTEFTGLAPNVTAFVSSIPVDGEHTFNLTLQVDPAYQQGSLVNDAEITAGTNARGIPDQDSSPGNNNGDDSETGTDNDIDDENPNEPGSTDNPNDNDDFDPASIEIIQIFDLALEKTVSSSNTGPFEPGDLVTFVIEVSNQGTLDAYNIEIDDYFIDGELILNDPNWTETAMGVASLNNDIDFIGAGELASVNIIFQIDPDYQGTDIINYAEITGADNDNNPASPNVDDEDSTPGDNQGDDELANDGEIVDSQTGALQDDDPDSDDYDPAPIQIQQEFDLALIKNYTGFNDLNTNGDLDPGESASFIITVFNQGTLELRM